MRTLSITLASLLFAGVAAAQTPPAKPAEKPAPPATPAKAPDSKATPAKTPDPKAQTSGAPATPPAKPEPPKPPQQIADMSKDSVGTWRCKGETMHMDGTKEAITSTNTVKVDMNKWWIVESMSVKGTKTAFTMTTYTTFDAGSNKWRRVAVDSMGNSYIGTSDGPKEKKLDWNLDVIGPMGGSMFRDHVDTSDAKVGVKLSGDLSMDKGKTWNKVYEMVCKK